MQENLRDPFPPLQKILDLCAAEFRGTVSRFAARMPGRVSGPETSIISPEPRCRLSPNHVSRAQISQESGGRCFA